MKIRKRETFEIVRHYIINNFGATTSINGICDTLRKNGLSIGKATVSRYVRALVDACMEDSKAKGRKGLCILAAAKKKPFLADPKFLKHKGFTVCDESNTDQPKFKECAKHPHVDEQGYVLYYTSQCPFNAKYVP